jgi:hypothetical protein
MHTSVWLIYCRSRPETYNINKNIWEYVMSNLSSKPHNPYGITTTQPVSTPYPIVQAIHSATGTSTATVYGFTTLIFFFNGSIAPWGPRPSHFSRLHDHTLDTPHSVGFLWTSDQPDAETST